MQPRHTQGPPDPLPLPHIYTGQPFPTPPCSSPQPKTLARRGPTRRRRSSRAGSGRPHASPPSPRPDPAAACSRRPQCTACDGACRALSEHRRSDCGAQRARSTGASPSTGGPAAGSRTSGSRDCGKQVYLGGFDTAHAAARFELNTGAFKLMTPPTMHHIFVYYFPPMFI
ncbi:hypothetical protein PVAP13_5KG073600 [Panicum virgatum]|uniref:AP2/ERF domain-containing protein n=1 Tax=Panicum virgatum TaxID=38727 RepID=A0A8T0SFL6_PANVG|nr:hypothetical protein PVAP13_5KG073600 [Panicum virgatum]